MIIIRDYQFYFNFPSVETCETCVKLRAVKFIRKYSAQVNNVRYSLKLRRTSCRRLASLTIDN